MVNGQGDAVWTFPAQMQPRRRGLVLTGIAAALPSITSVTTGGKGPGITETINSVPSAVTEGGNP